MNFEFDNLAKRLLEGTMPQGFDPKTADQMNQSIKDQSAQDSQRSSPSMAKSRPGGYDEPSNPQSSTTLTIDEENRKKLKSWLNSEDGKRFAKDRAYIWKLVYPGGKLECRSPRQADNVFSALKTYANTDFGIKRDTQYSY